jgi:hypothetical protein
VIGKDLEKNQRKIENQVKIYYWSNKIGFGHVSLGTRGARDDNSNNGIYVSFWPQYVIPQQFTNYDGDMAQEKYKNPKEYELYNLKVDKLEEAFRKFRDSEYKWTPLGSSFIFARNRNCSGLVSYLLIEGGINKYFPFKKNALLVLLHALSANIFFELLEVCITGEGYFDKVVELLRMAQINDGNWAASVLPQMFTESTGSLKELQYFMIQILKNEKFPGYLKYNMHCIFTNTIENGFASMCTHFVAKRYFFYGSMNTLNSATYTYLCDKVLQLTWTMCVLPIMGAYTFKHGVEIELDFLKFEWIERNHYLLTLSLLSTICAYIAGASSETIFNLPFFLMNFFPRLIQANDNGISFRENILMNNIHDLTRYLSIILGSMLTSEIPLSSLVFTPAHVEKLAFHARNEEIKEYNTNRNPEEQITLRQEDSENQNSWKKYAKPAAMFVGLGVVGFFAVSRLASKFEEYERLLYRR